AHDAVARAVAVVAGGDHGDLGVTGDVLGDDVGVVHPVDGVGGGDEDDAGVVPADAVRLAPQRVGRALVPALALVAAVGAQDHEPAAGAVQVPRTAAREVLGDRLRLELLEHPDVAHPAVGGV